MKINEEDFRKIILNAQQALRLGDRLAARHWAELAVELAPNSEEAWLTMAAVASPRASLCRCASSWCSRQNGPGSRSEGG